jgi:hypothetical protein
MRIRKVIRHRLRRRNQGVDLAADLNAVVSANVGGPHPRSPAPSGRPGAARAEPKPGSRSAAEGSAEREKP